MEKILKNVKYQKDPFETIDDLLGVRVITFIKSDLDAVKKIIEKEFEVLKGPDDKVEKLSIHEFGYRSIHYIVKLNQKRAELPECGEYKDFRAEIQIRTNIENAWAEIEHHWNYKPDNEDNKLDEKLKRRLNGLMAVLELVDREFDSIRKSFQTNFKSDEILLKTISDLIRSPELFEDICKFLFDKERYGDLVQITKQAVIDDQDNIKAWTNMAIGLLYLENYKELLKISENFIKLYPNRAIYYIVRANAFSGLGEYKKTIIWYDKALKLEPKNKLALVDKGIALAKLGDYDEASKWIEKALEFEPDYAHALVSKGIILTELGKPQDAIQLFDMALGLVPDYDPGLVNKGVALIKLQKYDEASQIFDKVLEHEPKDVHALINKGIALAELGNSQEAIQLFDKALEFQPEKIEALVNKTKSLIEIGKCDEALEWINKASEIDPENVRVLFHKGRVLDGLGRTEEAKKIYEQAFEDLPEDFYEFYNNRKNINQLELEPEDIQAFMGILLAKDGEHKDAMNWINSALKLNPKNKIALIGKSFALEKLEKYEDALIILKNILLNNPDDALVLYRLARIQSLIGNDESALETLASAINLDEQYKSKAKDDKAFEVLKEKKEFKKLTS